ncbi:hypothetical protein [Ruminococcus bicirculans (ex Wegman et al. 2014)]|uniref:hypothetical protein n=1 Tax=Ruminococcus bicirculans (ex Wegman et al. 2014) TaxID=1160721 RepID=UPI0011064F7C|nr:hypothetical protein FFK04_01140 [Ruminococcus sp. KGMB03662]
MKTIKYRISLPTAYLKGEVTHEQNFVKLKTPNILFSLLAIGTKTDVIPVNQIATVTRTFNCIGVILLFGIILMWSGFSVISASKILSLSSSLAPIILILLGVLIIITSFQTVITIKTTSGEALKIPVLIFDRSKALEIEDLINQLISNRLDDTNNRQQTDRIVEAITNK